MKQLLNNVKLLVSGSHLVGSLNSSTIQQIVAECYIGFLRESIGFATLSVSACAHRSSAADYRCPRRLCSWIGRDAGSGTGSPAVNCFGRPASKREN